jgi:hypothetical protein
MGGVSVWPPCRAVSGDSLGPCCYCERPLKGTVGVEVDYSEDGWGHMVCAQALAAAVAALLGKGDSDG